MRTSYRLNAKELDQHFLKSLQTLFQDREIEIVIYDVDETAYLSQSEANQQKLLKAIENVENGTNLIEVDLEAFRWVGRLYVKLLRLKILATRLH